MKQVQGIVARETIKLWLKFIFEMLLFLPIWIVFQASILPDRMNPIWMITLPLLALIGIAARHRLNIRWKQLLAAFVSGTALGMLSGGFNLSAIPLAAAGWVCTYLGLTVHARRHSFQFYWIAVILYFIAGIAFRRLPQLESGMPVLTWCGSFCLLVILLQFNRSHLRSSSYSGDSAPLPAGLRRHNYVAVIVYVLAAAALAAGAGKALGIAVWNAIRLVLGWIVRIFSGSSSPVHQPVAQEPATPQPTLGEAGEPGLLAAIFDLVLYGLAILLIGGLAYLALRALYRNSRGIWRRTIDRILSMLRKVQHPQENAAYLDEEKSIFTWEKKIKDIKDFWSARLPFGTRRDRWEEMSGGSERARWLYRHWLETKRKRGYVAKGYLTPRETGADVRKWTEQQSKDNGDRGIAAAPEGLFDIYEQARYSNEEPPAVLVAELKKHLNG